MKDCMQCGAAASDEIKFCGECGLQFSFVGPPELAQTLENSQEAPLNTSWWIKLGTVSVAILATFFAYNQLYSFMVSGCQATALSGRTTVYIVENVKWTPLGCRYLTRWKSLPGGGSINDDAEWRTEDDVFISDEIMSKVLNENEN
jgi:hypothetical protein